MEIRVIRKVSQTKNTVSDFLVNGNKLCDCLEDIDRGIKSTDPIEYLNKKIIRNDTAIPYGTYKVIVDYSNRFKCDMPHVLDVPGFEGIRIHKGNTDADTSGCLLLGTYVKEDFIAHSTEAYLVFIDMLNTTLNKEEEVWLTIERG
jgi:hypothetical protein